MPKLKIIDDITKELNEEIETLLNSHYKKGMIAALRIINKHKAGITNPLHILSLDELAKKKEKYDASKDMMNEMFDDIIRDTITDDEKAKIKTTFEGKYELLVNEMKNRIIRITNRDGIIKLIPGFLGTGNDDWESDTWLSHEPNDNMLEQIEFFGEDCICMDFEGHGISDWAKHDAFVGDKYENEKPKYIVEMIDSFEEYGKVFSKTEIILPDEKDTND